MLRMKFPKMHILVMSQLEEMIYAEKALRAGAAGYISKDRATEDLIGAMRTILAGKIHLSERVSARLTQPTLHLPSIRRDH
jgi:DNA-binding NarL/FixJ family response regulator